MQWLKQSTATTLKIGPFVDEDDGKTAETGLTISQADVRLSKNGGNMAQKNEASACTHDELGDYDCPIDATDTNTLGRLRLHVHESGALPVWRDFMIVPGNVWDTFFGADALQVDTIQIEGVDATNQIRDSVVDDATRIDASALNTLSGLAPGSTIAAASDVPAMRGTDGANTTAPDAAGTAAGLHATTDALINDLNDLSAAQVNAEVADVLKVDTVTLPGQETPTETPTLEEILAYLYKVLRNRLTQTDTTMSLYNNAGTIVDQKATVSDDLTTFDRGALVSGP